MPLFVISFVFGETLELSIFAEILPFSPKFAIFKL